MQVREVFLSDNRANPTLRFDSYHFFLKNKGKLSASFVCSTKSCYASVSLFVNRENNEIEIPFRIYYLNENHLDSCVKKEDSFFLTRAFMSQVRNEIVTQPTITVQQIYESKRSAHRVNSDLTLPDYGDIKSGLKKIRAKVNRFSST